MYSWVGEDRFEDRSLDGLVRSGATSTGTFASFLGSIFGTNDATFSYNGDIQDAGRALAEFGFRVPVEKSKYRIGSKLHQAVVGYDGTFLADPETLDLARLTVHADRLPAELDVCASTTTLNYGKLRLGGSEFSIPKDANWKVIYPDGTELENRTVFSACHEFRGESTLRFDSTPPAQGPVARKITPGVLTLPWGLPFMVAFTQPIDTATAAAGDLVAAKLTSPIRDRLRGVLVPKDAAVTARIVRIERHYGEGSVSLTLAFRLEAMEKDGAMRPFDATLESVVKRRQKPVNAMLTRQDLGSFDQMLDRENPGVGVLQFADVTDDYVIQRDLRIEGRTAGAE